MSKTEVAVANEKSLAKGLIAGLIGGVIGTLTATVAERFLAPRRSQADAGAGLHFGFGVALGAAYGALAEYYPAATAKEGATFGMALGAITGEAAVPAPEAEEESTREQAGEVTSYVVYGVTTEWVRSFVRNRI